MCGLFGCLSRAGRGPSPAAAAAALATLGHRGPDAHGLLHRPELGLVLGHARLSIIDPDPRSDQPLAAAGSVLVFNGEVYNYRELRRELVALGEEFRTQSDTEVILAGYRRWGTDVFDRLRGMYALALYDEARQRLHLLRDEFGIKPLCLFQRGDELVFASEVKAIAALHPLSVDGGILPDLLAWGFPMQGSSLYGGVRQLSPATLSTLSRDPAGVWQPTQRELSPTRAAWLSPGAEPSAAELRAVVDAAVADHLIADVPVSIALSGGLDSSVVAQAAARHSPGIVAHTFTLGQGADPETEHAALLCRHLGIQHRVARLVEGDVQGWLRRVAWHLEEPMANVNAMVTYGLAALVREQGFKVVLVGEGADQLFAGYPWYRFALDAAHQGDPGAVFDAYRRRRAQSGAAACLRPGAQAVAAARMSQQRQAFADRLAAMPLRPLDGFLSFDADTQLQHSQLLRVDRMFMAHGVEARVPFLYRSVLEASAALPAARKLGVAGGSGRMEKLALAEAFAPLLPERIVMRPKFGAQGTVDIWGTWLADGLGREFERCLHGGELRPARQLLDEFIDWRKVAGQAFGSKEKFALALLLEAVDATLLSRARPDGPLPLRWEMV